MSAAAEYATLVGEHAELTDAWEKALGSARKVFEELGDQRIRAKSDDPDPWQREHTALWEAADRLDQVGATTRPDPSMSFPQYLYRLNLYVPATAAAEIVSGLRSGDWSIVKAIGETLDRIGDAREVIDAEAASYDPPDKTQTLGDLKNELVTTRSFLTHLRLSRSRWVDVIEGSDAGMVWGGVERCAPLYTFGHLMARIRKLDEPFWRTLCAREVPRRLRRNLKPADYQPSWADRALIRPSGQ